jgi:hypothetical protein
MHEGDEESPRSVFSVGHRLKSYAENYWNDNAVTKWQNALCLP